MNKILLTLALLTIFLITLAPNAQAALECTKANDKVTCSDKNYPDKSWTWELKKGKDKISSGAMKGCQSLPSKISEFSGCIMCPMYKTLFSTTNNLIQKAFDSLASVLKKIMAIVFALLIAVKTLGQLSSISPVSTNSYIDDLFKQTFKFAIAFFFLSSYDQIFYWILTPLLKAGLEFGGGFLFNTDVSTITATSMAEGGLLDGSVYEKIDIFTQAVQRELSFMQAIGSSLICIAFHDAAAVKYILPDGSMLISGAVMYIFGLTISIAFGFYLIDAMLQLCIVGIMTPFSIACYPFSFSQKWMMTTWSMFLDCFFKFVFMGLVISIVTQVMAMAVTKGMGGYDVILDAMNNSNADLLSSFFDITSIAFLTFICCAIFAKKFTKEASKLAASMSGGSVIEVGGALGGMAMSALTNPAKRMAGKKMKGMKKAMKKKLKGAFKKKKGGSAGKTDEKPKPDEAKGENKEGEKGQEEGQGNE